MRKGLQEKLENIKKDGSYLHNIYDPLVFSTIKAQAGGRLRMLMSGAAPTAKDVQELLKVTFCCSYPEAYGMTETAGGSIYAHTDDQNTGHVGGNLACMKVRLRDIPEMGYYYEDPEGGNPKGEICFKGTNIFTGYYKQPERTAESFDEEGWFLSGDVAEVRPDGSLRIIDRAKNIFKLMQGEYVAPEKLENIFIQSKLISQAWIHGDPTKDFIVALLVVDPNHLAAFCKDK